MKGKQNMKQQIIYDGLNKLVWVSGQASAGGERSIKFFGKDAKRFSSNVQARSYALALGKKHGLSVYDKYWGKTITSTIPHKTGIKKVIGRKKANSTTIALKNLGF